MFFKLALRNVRRSARDYAIYLVTVTLGVAIFYAFNAISSQAVLFDALSSDSERMLHLLNSMIGVFSGAVACVLGFLVVYANRFLIRRRKREFGTYLILGMGSGRVSRILLYETAMVGLLSLAVGLVIGIGVSQGLSFATAALMGTTMSKYQFIISNEAILLTVVCFLIVFAVSAAINIVYINRCKLISLLSKHQSNESSGSYNVPLRVVVFLLSVALLAAAYWQLHINGLQIVDIHFGAATALMVAGTFAFFWSVSGFAVSVLQRIRGIYFKGVSAFTIRQISSKINTAFSSMAIICIMLFLALTTTSIGMSLVEAFTGNIKEVTAYDMTLATIPNWVMEEDSDDYPEALELYREYDGDIAACITDRGGSWNDFVKDYAQLDYYGNGIMWSELLESVPGIEGIVSESYLDSSTRIEVTVVGASQYNAQCRLLGEQGISLAEDECAVNNLLRSTDAAAQALVDNQTQISVGGTDLHFSGEVQRIPMRTTAMTDVMLEVIVPDAVIEALASNAEPERSSLNLMYTVDRAVGDDMFLRYMHDAFPAEDGFAERWGMDPDKVFTQYGWPVSSAISGAEMADQASGLRMVVSYLALYIGFVLLVAVAAILAIQQLSETVDSMPRYRRLRDLGCDSRMVFGSLRTQTVVYFLAPLFIAACHTACAIIVANETLFQGLGVDISGSVGLCVGLVVAIYVVYLLVTYVLSRSIVRDAIDRRFVS